MSALYLGYETAKWYWEQYHDNVAQPNERPARGLLADCIRDVGDVRNAVTGTIFRDWPLDVLVPLGYAGKADGVTFHGCSAEYPARSFVQACPDIYIASPELSFIQVASDFSFAETLMYGYSLCGNFALSQDTQSGLVDRSKLVTARRLSAYANSCVGHHGVALARRVVRYVREESASPRESKLSIALTLPLCCGGKGLPPAKMNKRIEIPDCFSWWGGRRYYVADLYWESARVTVEYDSDMWHAHRQGIYRDSDKRNTLIDMGYAPLCFTSLQLDDPAAFDHAAESLRRKLGVRRRRLPSNYQGKVDELRKGLGLSVLPYAPRRVDDSSILDFSW